MHSMLKLLQSAIREDKLVYEPLIAHDIRGVGHTELLKTQLSPHSILVDVLIVIQDRPFNGLHTLCDVVCIVIVPAILSSEK